jgi:hypothetical protein
MVRTAFKALWNWTCDPAHQYRSWIAHTLVVCLIAFVFGVLPAVLYYFLREVEQIVVKVWVEGGVPDYTDMVMDVVVMMFGLGIVATVFGWR